MKTAVSQPLPSPSSLDDLTRNFCIADFGSVAQIVEPDDKTTDGITPFPPDRGIDANAGHLRQMPICFTGEEFDHRLFMSSLDGAREHHHILSERLVISKRNGPRFIYPFETLLRKYKVISEEDMLVTATFMRRCLRLDPHRPSAEQLLVDTFYVLREECLNFGAFTPNKSPVSFDIRFSD
ncbi:hypothetical protein IW262DRAFT_1301323 [Armillaria fumosa]|nr:hypothetical protein IW262DRAFT_1301323 [Armillaria fumosa]